MHFERKATALSRTLLHLLTTRDAARGQPAIQPAVRPAVNMRFRGVPGLRSRALRFVANCKRKKFGDREPPDLSPFPFQLLSKRNLARRACLCAGPATARDRAKGFPVELRGRANRQKMQPARLLLSEIICTSR